METAVAELNDSIGTIDNTYETVQVEKEAVPSTNIDFNRKQVRIKSIDNENGYVFSDNQIVNDLYDMIEEGKLAEDAEVSYKIAGNTEETKSTLREFAKTEFKLDTLYRPIWSHTWAGLTWGCIVGIVLKMLDTAAFLFMGDPLVGVMFIAALAICFIPRIGFMGFAAFFYFSFKMGIPGNLFLTVITSAAVGAILGMLPGMSIGTLVGLVRSRYLPRAPLVQESSGNAFICGFLLPLISGLTIILLWIFWITPMIIDWMMEL